MTKITMTLKILVLVKMMMMINYNNRPNNKCCKRINLTKVVNCLRIID